jgi:hypothetical protein
MMGTYSSEEFLETFGGLPDRGECFPADPDTALDVARGDRCHCGCEDHPNENGEYELCRLAEAHREEEAGA